MCASGPLAIRGESTISLKMVIAGLALLAPATLYCHAIYNLADANVKATTAIAEKVGELEITLESLRVLSDGIPAKVSELEQYKASASAHIQLLEDRVERLEQR